MSFFWKRKVRNVSSFIILTATNTSTSTGIGSQFYRACLGLIFLSEKLVNLLFIALPPICEANKKLYAVYCSITGGSKCVAVRVEVALSS